MLRMETFRKIITIIKFSLTSRNHVIYREMTNKLFHKQNREEKIYFSELIRNFDVDEI